MNLWSKELPLPVRAPRAEPPWVSRIRLRAQRRVIWQTALWSADAAGAMGLAISPGEVARILLDPRDTRRAERAFLENDPQVVAMAAPIRAADLATAADDDLGLLRSELGLDDAEVDLLTLAASIEVDPWLRRVFGYLHDDATSGLATPWLARQLFDWPDATRIAADSALVRWRLARPCDGQVNPWSITASWTADAHAVSCLLDGAAIDPRLHGAVRLVAGVEHDECLYPLELAAMATYVRALMRDAGPSIEILVTGAEGAGKRTLARQLCSELGIPLLVADAGHLFNGVADPATAEEAIIRVQRSARVHHAAVYWHGADTAVPTALRHAPGGVRLSIFGAREGWSAASVGEGTVRHTVRLPPLTRSARASLWASLTERAAPPQIQEWPLLPADLARAATAAPAGTAAIVEACRATVPMETGTLASRLPLPHAWEDLVVPPMVRRHLDELESQVRLRWSVYEEWGFGRLCAMGGGIAALFAGPSGTGKTMAAQVLARSLGMDCYRIDLAGMMSKYIGDTEKNLRRVFDACERANVVLFFDEADALFGRRTQVKDAHDRFANIEIDYLLQRMEQFDGLAILATNRHSDIDGAFLRRMRFVVDFVPPGVAERRALWSLALPAQAPDGKELLDGIDLDSLAARLELTGADIKAAAMGAAFMARAEGKLIGMEHVLRAARRELAKRGVVLRAGDGMG